METGDLILAILTFVAIVVALGIGVTNIRRTKSIQETERKQRLLNEIIEWALDVNNCEAPVATTAIAGIIGSENDKAITRSHLSELAYRCAEMTFRGRYVYTVILKSKFGQDLQRAAAELIDDLEVRIKLLGECHDAISASVPDSEFTRTSDKARQHWLAEVRESASKVIQEATEIKVKDIG